MTLTQQQREAVDAITDAIEPKFAGAFHGNMPRAIARDLARAAFAAVYPLIRRASLEEAARWHDDQSRMLELRNAKITRAGGWRDHGIDREAAAHRVAANALRALAKEAVACPHRT